MTLRSVFYVSVPVLVWPFQSNLFGQDIYQSIRSLSLRYFLVTGYKYTNVAGPFVEVDLKADAQPDNRLPSVSLF